jgi:glycine/serine hydroxymethyltransferase
MGEKEIDEIAHLVDQVLRQVEPVSDTRYNLDRDFAAQKQEQVKHLCSRFPMH